MTQMKTSSDEMKVAIIANGKPQSRRVASKLFNAFRDDPDFYLTKKNPDAFCRDSHGSFRLLYGLFGQ